MHELHRLKPTTNEVFLRIFFSKFSGTKRIIIIRFTALNIVHVVVNIDSEGLRKSQNLQFCVQVFSTDIELQEMIREEHELGALYCVMTRANFEISFSK